MTVEVSVVVPTFERPELLELCLAALVAQTFDPSAYEIVIADDAASERTRHQVEDWRRRCLLTGPPIHYLPVRDSQGPAAARNAGWRCARGRVIAFTDDDCIPEPEWLSAGVRAIRNGATGVSGRVFMPLPEDPTDYERNAAGLATTEFVTANCFYLRSALDAVGGFDERFAMAWREDSDLWLTFLERGETLVSAEDAVVVHPLRPAPWGVSLSQQRKSQYNALLYKKHPVLYRQRVQPGPPRDYYAIVASIVGCLLGLGLRRPGVAVASFLVWARLTGAFIARRLQGTSRRPAHIAEMVVTSALIPPLAVYWRLRGAFAYRVRFL
ncbi:MAG TPA: glycosyltransferase [Thermomicrobiales bacterium]|nr:glycosyltransferase [Thermomicrobiales bacterium]